MRNINIGDKVSYRDVCSLRDVVGIVEAVSTIDKHSNEKFVGKQLVSINIGEQYMLIYKLADDISILEYAGNK